MSKTTYNHDALEESCRMCREVPASHKVGEEMTYGNPIVGHNLTTYVCCWCFCAMMGSVAKSRCFGKTEFPDDTPGGAGWRP